MDTRSLMEVFAAEVPDENVRYLINSFLTNVKDIETVDKNFVIDFICSKSKTINTVNLYKSWLCTMFSIFICKGILVKNPAAEINGEDLNELYDKILNKKTFVTKDEILKIVDDYIKINKIRALCVYALFEGIRNDELAYLEKTDVDGKLLHIKGRNDPFVMEEKLQRLMEEIKNSDNITIQKGGIEYQKSLVKSNYIIRPLEGKRTTDEQIKILRSKVNYIRKEYHLNSKQIYESGFLHYAKQEDVTASRLKWLLKKYNMKASDAYMLLARGV